MTTRLTANKRRIRTRIGPRSAGRLITPEQFVLRLSRLLAKAGDWSRGRCGQRTRDQNPPTGGANG